MAPKSFPTRKLGANGPEVSAIGFGAMGWSGFYGQNFPDPFEILTYAYERGVTFWDTADIYGDSELRLGEWFGKYPERRKDIFLATKFGARKVTEPTTMTAYSEPSYVDGQVQASLKRLKTDYIDLYYQHRTDPHVPIETVLETLRPYVEKGVIKYIGLSECGIETLKRAKAVKGVGDKVIAAQMEFSPFSLDVEKVGFVKAARELGVGIVAYSPLGRGLASGKYRSRADFEPGDFRLSPLQPRFSEENFPKVVAIADEIKKVADSVHITSAQVALSWILAEHPDFIPIPGSRTNERLEENSHSAEITLPENAVQAIRKLAEDSQSSLDTRYGKHMMASIGAEALPLKDWTGKRQE